MDRKLIDYLPPVLREVVELQEINEANEPEISLAWDAMALILANQFLDSATEWGVKTWEEDLRIHPKDTDTLEARKTRLKAMWNLELPYTLPWLRRWVSNICGPSGHSETVQDYTVDIQLDYTILPDADALAAQILEMVLAIRPSNMRVLMTSALQSTGAVHMGAYTERSVFMDLWPLLVNELESSGGLKMAGPLEYHAKVEIYPFEQEENDNA